MALQNLTMILPSHLGWPLSLKTPNMGNVGLYQTPAILTLNEALLEADLAEATAA